MVLHDCYKQRLYFPSITTFLLFLPGRNHAYAETFFFSLFLNLYKIFFTVYLSWLLSLQGFPSTQETIWIEKYQGKHTTGTFLLIKGLQATAVTSRDKCTYYNTCQIKLYLLSLYYYWTNLNCQQHFWKILVLQDGSGSSKIVHFLQLTLQPAVSAFLTTIKWLILKAE